MRGLLLAFACVGCIDSEAPMEPVTPEPMELVADANGCHGTASLDGASDVVDAGRASFGPYVFGHGRFCLRLDARANRYAHLMAGSDRFDGAVAPISLVLERPDGTLLVEGGDVAFGQTDTKVFASLEMPVDGGNELDVVLVVDGTDVESTIAVSLFERLE